MHVRSILALVAALVLPVAVTACGSDDSTSGSGGGATTTLTTSMGDTPTTMGGSTSSAEGSGGSGGSGSDSPIPKSSAIDDLAENIAGNPKAAPIAAACTIVSALSSQKKAGMLVDDATTGERLSKLADAVEPIDTQVSAALKTTELETAAEWCTSTGFAN